MMAVRPFTAATVILLANTTLCDTTLNSNVAVCRNGPSQACCVALAAYNTALCLCPGYQTVAPASAISQALAGLSLCSLTPATCPASPSTPAASPSSANATLPGPVWAYAVLVAPTGLKVAWSFPPATVFTSFDLRRSGDPTFPAATTLTLSALPAANFTSPSDPAGVYGNFDALVARSGAPGQLYYSVRGTAASGQTTAWSGPIAAVNATVPGTLFAVPGGVTGVQCGSFVSPCGAIQDGLDAAATGSTLLLLPGTYAGPRNRGLSMAGKGIRVLGLAGSAGTTINCSRADRGFAFTSGESIAAGAAVQGLTITGGLAYAGAGMVFSGSSAAVSDVIITGCRADGSGTPLAGVTAQAGGGVSISNGNATFDRCTLSNNAAGTNGGGGLYIEGISVSVFTDMLITSNALFNPGRGGNVKLMAGPSPTFINVTITNGNGGLFAGGLWSDTGAPVLVNVTVANNVADYGAGMVVSQGSSLSCTACVIANNAATQFGGGAVTGGGVTGAVAFRNSVFANNTAAVQGGGIYVAAVSTTTFTNVSFTNNSAPNGGGLFIDSSAVTMAGGSSVTGNRAGALGGGLWCKSSSLALAPGTAVASNAAAGAGGGLYVEAQCNVTGSGVTITGGTALNGAGVYMVSGSSVNLTASSISNNAAGILASGTGGSSTCGASAASSASSGGGVYMAAPGASSTGPGPALALTACTVTNNTAAGDGGGITVLAGRAVLTAGSVANNKADGDGGGVAVKSQGQAVLASLAVLSNSAGGNGGGIAFGVTSQLGLVAVYGGTVAGNAAGAAAPHTGVGGGLSLGWPAYVVQGAVVANNTAYTGGGLSIQADFGASLTACRMAAALQLPCVAPLQGVVLTGNNASAGLSLFWLRSASPVSVVSCVNCTLPWPLRPSDLATEPLGLGFATPPSSAVQTGSAMPGWSVALQDYYASTAATAAAVCTLDTGAPLGGVAVSDATRLTLENSQAATALGLAAFNSTPHGLVGTTYPLLVTCTLSSTGALLPPLGFNITVAPCAAGTQVSSDGRACDACKANAEFNMQAGGTCKPCPLGGSCPSPTVLQALPDWWRSTNTSDVLFNCPLAGACLAGQPAGQQACLPGYTGPVCAVCAPGYYPWGHNCRRCDTNFGWVMPLCGALAVVAFVAMFALPVRADNVDPVVRAKLVMTFLQVQGLIKDYAITWRPKLLLGALSYFDVLNIGLEITAPACGDAPLDFYSTYVTTMMLPPAALGLCFTVWALHRCAMRRWRRARPQPLILFGRVLLPPRGPLSDDQVEAVLGRFTTRCLKNACWLVLLLYPGVCKKVMQLYGTRTLDTGAFLRSDYSVQTRDAVFERTGKYTRYAAGGILMCLLYPAGIPLLFAAAVRCQRKRAAADGTDLMDSYVGFLAAGYSPKALYWELLELGRKLAMAAIGVFAVDGAFNGSHARDVSGALSPVIQPFLGQLVTVVFLAALLYVQPYEKRVHNVVQAFCLFTTWACLLVGDSLFNTATQTGAINPGQQDGIGIWLGVVLCLWVAAILLWALDGWVRDMWDTLTTRFPFLFVRAGSQLKVVPLMLDAETGVHHRGSSSASVTPGYVGALQPEDGAHAKALAQVDVHDLARLPRVADGDKYQPAKLVVGSPAN